MSSYPGLDCPHFEPHKPDHEKTCRYCCGYSSAYVKAEAALEAERTKLRVVSLNRDFLNRELDKSLDAIKRVRALPIRQYEGRAWVLKSAVNAALDATGSGLGNIEG